MTNHIFKLNINGKACSAAGVSDANLLSVLRDGLNITSSKRGCNQGVCGSCTVMINGKNQRACLTLAAMCEDKNVQTVEGYIGDRTMEVLQSHFKNSGAVQCGFCTPGMLISAYALLQQNTSPSAEEVQSALSGNICRCTGYRKIIDGVQAAARELQA